MKSVISSEKLPIKIWTTDIEAGALEQTKHLANLPFAVKHIAIMPDCHQGYGMPIGGVLATQGVIIPNAVGVDIGCGMCAVRTSMTEMDKPMLKTVLQAIRERIPVGFNHQKEAQDENFMPPMGPLLLHPIVEHEYSSALKQLGTLGGGNHFIEIQKGSDGFIWVMLHSGSRNIGKKVADYYNKLAVSLNTKWHSAVPKPWELAFLPIESNEGTSYLEEMQYCVDFALANRQLMVSRIQELISWPDVSFDEPINIAHNYVALENHFGQNLMIHRKGATRAYEGQIGIIPGSQGSKSYIVKGKGNAESFKSCSHGAGRCMSRKKAREELNLVQEIKRLDDMGIVHAIRHKDDLDEAASAYKDIDVVMANQSDLVEIVTELTPLAVIKG